MNRDVFKIMFALVTKQPWLGEKSDILEHLLYEDCNNQEGRELLIDLINRFEFLDHDRYQSFMEKVALEVINDPTLFEQSTLISAMSIGHNADSGQAIIYSLKVLLQKIKWSKHLLINDAMQALKTFKRNVQLRDIILVDEFVGSGKTVIERVDTINRQFKEANITDYSIQVKVLAATEKGIEKIQNHGIKISSQIKIKRGISDHYQDEELKKRIELMIQMEKILSEEYNGRERPELGYGKAEALYYRQDTNLPNSVFPIFWWAEYSDKKPRDTLLFRAMGDA